MIQLKAHNQVTCSHHREVNGVGEQETTGISGGVVSAGKKPQEEEYAQEYKCRSKDSSEVGLTSRWSTSTPRWTGLAGFRTHIWPFWMGQEGSESRAGQSTGLQ